MSEFYRVFANDEDLDWGVLNVSFYGAAEWYIERRGIWQRNAATNKMNVASAPQ
jgi:hypothetical protein